MANKKVCVDLSKLFNNKGVSWIGLGIAGSFDHSGISVPGEILPDGITVTWCDIPFQFPKTSSIENDHICCEEQTIEVDPNSYRQIYVAGFSLYGDYSDRVWIHYEDGSSEDKEFGLSDWYSRTEAGNGLKHSEQVAMMIPYYYENGIKIQAMRGIWIQRLLIDPNKKLHSIRLPDNPYMFIFAITAEE
ncbi:hypothetical protein [Cohnella mopanensis]|uniref:hypothetical protein n=1 Tax=Cohnella mopanensis TaxID=2911966 RepID=UPI001EF8F640|nr:hypothetical protein [Cohnella mopanensis]